MRKRRVYGEVTKRFYRSEMVDCPKCGTRLQRYATLSQRTVITLEGPIRVTHCGYRCPNRECPGATRRYRSAAADALALPGFTFGLDVVVWVGQQHLGQHQTLDEMQQALLVLLATWEVSISRREVLYLFEAYCTLLAAAQQDHNAPDWLAWREQVQANGGIILSIDGIQPDKGNETVYLVRDTLTGRLLTAANVTRSDTETIKQVLARVVALGLPVLGAISDAQLSLVQAIGELWPRIPHQLCQFHYLREASRPMYELDRSLKVAVRKTLQPKISELRRQLTHPSQAAVQAESAAEASDPGENERVRAEAEQLAVLADYALGVQTALNLDGQQPFDYAGLAAYDALTDVADSLAGLEKKGSASVRDVRPNSPACR